MLRLSPENCLRNVKHLSVLLRHCHIRHPCQIDNVRLMPRWQLLSINGSFIRITIQWIFTTVKPNAIALTNFATSCMRCVHTSLILSSTTIDKNDILIPIGLIKKFTDSMSRFAALRDDDDNTGSDSSPEAPEFERLSPQYTIQEILDVAKSDVPGPPTELNQYQNFFQKDAQSPEISTFSPPKSDINSKNCPTSKQTARRPNRATRGGKTSSQRSDDGETEDLGACWFYKDPMDRVIGPYPSKRMREWLDRKLINGDLLIRSAAAEGRFQPICVTFPDLSRAFADTGGVRSDGGGWQLTTLVSFSVSDDDASWDQESK